MNTKLFLRLMADWRMRKRLFPKTLLQAVRREPRRPRADSVPSWWRPGCINEPVVEVPVPHFREETGELTNRDQLLNVPVASTGVKSLDDGEAWPP